MVEDVQVTTLLESAARGAEWAWAEIVRRYTPLVRAVCRRCGVVGADAEDVSGSVWLRLVAGLGAIREPKALPGWLATTVRRECVSLVRERQRLVPSDTEPADPGQPEPDAGMLADERLASVRHAVRLLPERDRTLLSMLFSDPPTPYADISAALGMPLGAIGPTRQRCLARVRSSAVIAALLADGELADGELAAEDHRRSA